MVLPESAGMTVVSRIDVPRPAIGMVEVVDAETTASVMRQKMEVWVADLGCLSVTEHQAYQERPSNCGDTIEIVGGCLVRQERAAQHHTNRKSLAAVLKSE